VLAVFLRFDESRPLIEHRLAALAVPVTPKILSVDTWSPHVQMAAQYRPGPAKH